MNKAAISLSTGLEDPEKVTVAFLVAVGAAGTGRPTMMFLAKEAVRLAVAGAARAPPARAALRWAICSPATSRPAAVTSSAPSV